MSTLKVNTIQDTTGNDALTIDSSGNVTASQGFVPSTQLSHRNLIINGAMQVAQRGTSVTGVTSTGYRTCDRFLLTGNDFGTYTVSQESDSPDGFSNSFKLACTTTDTTVDSTQELKLQHRIEAQDLQHLAYGTSNAKVMTLSFWVKSNKTGTYVVWCYRSDNSRHVQTQYTINTADTWEKKTVTIPADTTGVINNDNGRGIDLSFILKTGSGYLSGTAASSWETLTSANRYVGQTVNISDSTSNYWQITGVQLEVGSVATPFEHRSYGEELARCKRYYYRKTPYNSNYNFLVTSGTIWSSVEFYGFHPFEVEMRTAPTASASGTNAFQLLAANAALGYYNGSDFTFSFADKQSIMPYLSSLSTSGTAGHAGWIRWKADGYMEFDAEL